ncbi:uncharacterized protein MONBRDRAFT_28031 [Monosiga brevicollis MX1]|uniref:Spectrin beta chain n=1 Tax=Monosiga brevicollis TaxID=81824 RepID=A9V703_MONBE|nr:uncharacterized protein MONBRDRAFT_28031 [Monosiga brevicollis MX1]EDQ86636.1 predicted protein [Monosiga brevicollis MX1]|eukprot:XP_001748472.1 hypothetical protein [Monosiga brevicollis MX1]
MESLIRMNMVRNSERRDDQRELLQEALICFICLCSKAASSPLTAQGRTLSQTRLPLPPPPPLGASGTMASQADWERLQHTVQCGALPRSALTASHAYTNIFTRWCNQRLAKRQLDPMADVVTDIGKQNRLIQLVEILSERTCDKKIIANARVKAQEIENLTKALEFVYECGVDMKLKPSPENLYDGDDRAVLGLIWALMMKYLKFAQEDDENLSPKEALLRWVNLNTNGHAHAEVSNFTKDFQNGMALCALIHKFRPELIPYDSLDPADKLHNLRLAITAAGQYFGMEPYLTAEDIGKLDEKSMLVFVSEFYSGITEQLKLELAARRIAQVVAFTMTNDELKARYLAEAAALHTRIQQAEAQLTAYGQAKSTTMTGALQQLSSFNKYRSTEKRDMYSEHIKLEALFTNLATRLADNSRPPFLPDEPHLRVEVRADRLKGLLKLEQDVGLFLHKEVSRQHRLQQLDQEHHSRYNKLIQWTTERESNLPDVDAVKSSGQARNLLKLLESTAEEIQSLQDTSVAKLREIRETLAKDTYEFLARVEEREKDLSERLGGFSATLMYRAPGFEDALQRETLREQVEQRASVHKDMCEQVTAWGHQEQTYLQTKEAVTSYSDAKLQLSLLDGHAAERQDQINGPIQNIKELGRGICSASYESTLSRWQFADTATILRREGEIDTLWAELERLASEKHKVLEDDVAREAYARDTRLLAQQHLSKSEQLNSWADGRCTYLRAREPCDDEATARLLLGLLGAFHEELDILQRTDVATWVALGRTILDRRYTGLSSYVYEDPTALQTREQQWQARVGEMNELATAKKPFLEDHLARVEFQESVRLQVRSHADAHALLQAWYTDKRAFLQRKEVIQDVQSALFHLGLLATFQQELADVIAGPLTALRTLGTAIRDAKYESTFSSWVYEEPSAVTALETEVEAQWMPELERLAQDKVTVLQDDLAREQFRDRTQLQVGNHREMFDALEAWAQVKVAYLEHKEDVHDSEAAKTQLSLLAAFRDEKRGMHDTSVASLRAAGEQIRAAEYQTSLSSWRYEQPDAVSALEAQIEARWQEMDALADRKQAVLEDDRDRELYAEHTRLLAGRHDAEAQRLNEWADEREAYLKARETCDTIAQAQYLLAVLDQHGAFKRAKSDSTLVSFHRLGQEILARKYETSLSTYVYETPELVQGREASLAERWQQLDTLAAEKLPFLQDHLARNEFQNRVRLMVSNHRDSFQKLSDWAKVKEAYLQTREAIHSVTEAKLHLSLLDGFRTEKQDISAGAVAALNQLGQEIRDATYSTSYSSWQYEQPDEVSALESRITTRWAELDGLATEKQAVLDDHLAREEYAEQTRLLAGQHLDQHNRLQAWATEKQAYLDVRETVDTVQDAHYHLSVHQAYVGDKATVTAADLASLQKLGANILARSYKTALSAYTYEEPASITDREASLAAAWQQLDAASAVKLPILEDHLARNVFQEKVRLWVRNHQDAHASLRDWSVNRQAYLETKEHVESIAAAELARSVLDAFRQEKADVTKGNLAALRDLGNQIRTARYETVHSNWAYEHPEAVTALEEEIAGPTWAALDQLAEAKQAVLDDDLAREQFKEATRLKVQNHKRQHEQLDAWCQAQSAYLTKKEDVTNSTVAKAQLSRLELHVAKKADLTQADKANHVALGEDIRAAKYETGHSSWVYEAPATLLELEASLATFWQQLQAEHAAKLGVLEDDLARETYAEETRLLADQHEATQSLLRNWVEAKQAYLQQREAVDSTRDARFHISLLEAFMHEHQAKTETSLTSFQALGANVLARKYATSLSSYVYEKPEAVREREATLVAPWEALLSLGTDKRAILDDHLARCLFQDETRLAVRLHGEFHGELQKWAAASQSYLDAREVIETEEEATLQLNLHAAHVSELEDKRTGALAALETRGGKIRSARYETSISAWSYEKPDEVQALEAALLSAWAGLREAAATKADYLKDAQSRNQVKAAVLLLADRHDGACSRLMQWAGSKTTYLDTREALDSLVAVAVAQRLLEAFDREKEMMQNTALASVKALGAEVKTTTYQSSLSSWQYAEPQQIDAREAQIDAAMISLHTKGEAKRTRLAEDERREEAKEELRHRFAHAAHAFQSFVKDNVIFLLDKQDSNSASGAATYGFTLEETLAFKAELDREDVQLVAQADALKGKATQLDSELAAYGAVTNDYTSLTTTTLDGLSGELQDAIKQRLTTYQQELERKQANDGTCREYADRVHPLLDHMYSSMDKLARPEGTLEEQLALIEQAMRACDDHDKAIADIHQMEKDMQARAITFNPHTTVTAEDLEIQLQDFRDILRYKQPLLEKEIEFKRSRGVTAEQLQEIEDFFRNFDKDNSGSIERKELKACLFSLGEELTSQEVEGYVKKFGGANGSLSINQFRDLMVHLIGVIHTQQSILDAFRFIGRGDESMVAMEKLQPRLTKAHFDFIVASQPATATGQIDYPKFVDNVFAR